MRELERAKAGTNSAKPWRHASHPRRQTTPHVVMRPPVSPALLLLLAVATPGGLRAHLLKVLVAPYAWLLSLYLRENSKRIAAVVYDFPFGTLGLLNALVAVAVPPRMPHAPPALERAGAKAFENLH